MVKDLVFVWGHDKVPYLMMLKCGGGAHFADDLFQGVFCEGFRREKGRCYGNDDPCGHVHLKGIFADFFGHIKQFQCEVVGKGEGLYNFFFHFFFHDQIS